MSTSTVSAPRVTSAGYLWGRAGGAILCLTHYIVGFSEAIWTLLYSDEGESTGRGEHYERGLLLHMFTLVILGLRLSWRKVKGGTELEWIGYWVDVGRFELGISTLRAACAVRWLTKKANGTSGFGRAARRARWLAVHCSTSVAILAQAI